MPIRLSSPSVLLRSEDLLTCRVGCLLGVFHTQNRFTDLSGSTCKDGLWELVVNWDSISWGNLRDNAKEKMSFSWPGSRIWEWPCASSLVLVCHSCQISCMLLSAMLHGLIQLACKVTSVLYKSAMYCRCCRIDSYSFVAFGVCASILLILLTEYVWSRWSAAWAASFKAIIAGGSQRHISCGSCNWSMLKIARALSYWNSTSRTIWRYLDSSWCVCCGVNWLNYTTLLQKVGACETMGQQNGHWNRCRSCLFVMLGLYASSHIQKARLCWLELWIATCSLQSTIKVEMKHQISQMMKLIRHCNQLQQIQSITCRLQVWSELWLVMDNSFWLVHCVDMRIKYYIC